MTLSDYTQIWSDMYKDAYGFRPRGPLPNWGMDEWEAEFNRLGAIIKENMEAESASQKACIVEVEKFIASLIKRGATSRTMALRWLHDAHGTGGDNEYLCYQLGLPYGYFR